jgi:hypothetical protein
MRFDWIWKYTKDGVRDGVYLQLIKDLVVIPCRADDWPRFLRLAPMTDIRRGMELSCIRGSNGQAF